MAWTSAWWASWVVAVAVAGPPKLPPMPGQSAPDPSPPPSAKLPSTPAPAKPKPAAAPPATAPTPAPTAAATVPPPSAEVPPPAFTPGKGGAEPPQPEPTAQPRKPLRDGPGSAPAMGPAPLPGGDEAAGAKKLPPPKRPPYRGIGLFVGAGVTFAVALSEQIAAHVITKRRCIEPVAEQAAMTDPLDDETDAEEIGNAIIECLPGVLPAVALRINSDLALVAMIGMATAGAILRAERTAYDDAFAGRTRPRMAALRGAGIGMVAVGATTWLTLGPTAWGLLANCKTAKCATRARAMGFSTRDVGLVLVAAGAAMIGFGEGYRRKHEHYARERALLWAPVISRGYAGVALRQRF